MGTHQATGSPCAPSPPILGEEILGVAETGARTGSRAQISSSHQGWPGETATQSQLAAIPASPRAPLQSCEEQVWLAWREGAEKCAGISLCLLCNAKLWGFFPQKYL